MLEGQLLWTPSDPDATEMARFMRERGFSDYDELWRWSVEDLDGFWGARLGVVRDRAGIRARAREPRDAGRRVVPGRAAELRRAPVPGRRGRGRRRSSTPRSRAAARDDLGRARAIRWRAARPGLRRLGVGRGDRVAAYMPNVPETVIAFLATARASARSGRAARRSSARRPWSTASRRSSRRC